MARQLFPGSIRKDGRVGAPVDAREPRTHAEDKLSYGIVRFDDIADLQHVGVGAGEHLFAEPRPFLADVGEFDISCDKPKIPACPLAFERTDQLIAIIKHVELATDRKELLLESSDDLACVIANRNARQKNRNAPADAHHGLALRRCDVHLKRCHALVVGKSHDLRDDPQPRLTAMKDDLTGGRITACCGMT